MSGAMKHVNDGQMVGGTIHTMLIAVLVGDAPSGMH